MNRHKNRYTCKKVRCPICNIEIPFLGVESHRLSHTPIGSHPHSSSHDPAVPSQVTLPSFHLDDGYSDLYLRFQKYIESSINTGPFTTTYNYQLTNLNNETLVNFTRQVTNTQTSAFKISASLGYILRNNETQELVYYWASRNNQLLFDQPFLVNCQRDIDSILESVAGLDLKSHVVFPNTRFSFIKSTNITFYLTHLHGVPIGSGLNLPGYLMRNKGLYSLVNAKRSGKPYDDNLCLFRCIALHNGATLQAVETPTKQYFQLYCVHIGINSRDFTGVTISDLEQVSQLFGIGINVYEQCEQGLSKLLFRTVKQENIMYLNLYHNHFSFIKDLQKFSSSYCCSKCKKIFSRHWNLKQHLSSCDATTRKIYGSGIYRVPESIFDTLEINNIIIPPELRFHEHRICFDIECYMDRDTTIPNTDRVTYSFKHQLASVSVCSNVPGYTDPKCFIADSCPKKLVKDMLSYMGEISEEVSLLQREKFVEFIPSIEALDDTKLHDRFYEYISQTPVLSFHGSGYDLKVIKEQLISSLLEMEEVRYVIKRGSTYPCIATESFRFLDITSYLAAGVSYDGFLKAYNAPLNKGYFPYEYFDSLEKLNSREFPLYEHFYSSLKGKNSLEPCKSENLSPTEITMLGREPNGNNPLTATEVREIGHMRYFELLEKWNENGWTFREFLIDYNNRWVKLFICYEKLRH